MDGQINQQRSSYRQGLVLGLTMAEIMLLLVFCLLIAMATFLKSERNKLDEAKRELEEHQAQSQRDHAMLSALRQNPALSEKLASTAGGSDGAMDEFWRDLVASKAAISDLQKDGSSLKDIRDKIADMTTLRANGIDVEKALRDAQVVDALKRATPSGKVPSPQEIADLISRGSAPTAASSGHHWPPIITLSEAGGYYFKTGSAELSPSFRTALMTTTPDEILKYAEQFDVDVIEVVGHTDEQAFGIRQVASLPDGSPAPLPPPRQSNLDRDLATILRSGGDIARLTPVDNAGLGLARAVSVISVLRQSPKLAKYKLIPLSGAQLINTDETLALSKTSGGDVAQRRRIEVRLRKSLPQEAVASVLPPSLSTPPPPPLRPPKPKVVPLNIIQSPRPAPTGPVPR